MPRKSFSVFAGQIAAENITTSETRSGVIEVWELDLASYGSVKAFSRRAKELSRLDAVVVNAGVYSYDLSMAEHGETTIMVNVVSTMLLGLLLLSKLRETSVAHNTKAVLTFTGSFIHHLTAFPERKSESIFEDLCDPSKARMRDRYNVSKMIQLLLFRELAACLAASDKPGRVVTSIVNRGFVATDIMREATGFWWTLYLTCLSRVAARTPEMGSRTLVHAAYGAEETLRGVS